MYSWFIGLITFFFPDIPFLMRFRGFLYSLGIKKCGYNFQVSRHCIIRGLDKLSIGNNVYLAPNSIINAIGAIIIEDEVMIAFNSVIVSGNHIFSNNSYRFGKSQPIAIEIKRGAWVSANCTVTGGSKIGEGTVIGANSMVRGSVDSNSLYAGVPVKKIKERN